jgi:hypothetical protein
MQIDERVGDDKGRSQPEHELNIRRARLALSGRIGERVAYNTLYQGDGANANTASLLEGYIEVALWPWLGVRVGQYKYYFDIEGRESDAGTPLVDRAFVTTAVAGGLNGASTASNPSGSFRDRGLTLSGTRGAKMKWSYSAGAFQGQGRASDNNNELAYVLGAGLDPGYGLRFNAGFLSADNTARGTNLTPAQAEKNTFRAWTVGGAYDRGRFFARAEYYQGQRTRGRTEQDLDGFYLVGAWTAASRVELLARYHAFQDERFPAGNDHMDGVDVAVKYYFDRRDRRSGTFVIVDYAIRNADAGVNSGLTLLNDGRGAALESGRDVANVLTVRLQVRF